jgi:hypothetical protein
MLAGLETAAPAEFEQKCDVQSSVELPWRLSLPRGVDLHILATRLDGDLTLAEFFATL